MKHRLTGKLMDGVPAIRSMDAYRDYGISAQDAILCSFKLSSFQNFKSR